MNRRRLLAILGGMWAGLTATPGQDAGVAKSGSGSLEIRGPFMLGHCPVCYTKAKRAEMDKPCSYYPTFAGSMDDRFTWDAGWLPGAQKINPDKPDCEKVDLVTGTRDWRQHICHVCHNLFAIPKDFLT